MSVVTILGGVIAFFRAIPILDSYVQQFISLYVTTADSKTQAAIADAAAFAARATTDQQRFDASKKWQDALSRTRVIP